MKTMESPLLRYTGPDYTFIDIRFEDDVDFKTDLQLNTLLLPVSEIEHWKYTCIGEVVGQPKRAIVVIGWKAGDEPESATRFRSAEFWSPLRPRLSSDVAIIHVAIRLDWPHLFSGRTDITEIDFVRGPTEVMMGQDLADQVDTLCWRTTAMSPHEDPTELVGGQGSTAFDDGRGRSTVVLFFWWKSRMDRDIFIDPDQDSAGGPKEYAELITELFEEITAAGGSVEKLDISCHMWYPEPTGSRKRAYSSLNKFCCAIQ
ncbi:hypothetical protein F4677DRAFT_439291 [Hypoxylon crocopeplum]|nr:hypothetical protein F4677DRAFT_439291 [Hypoxylon crocopeplum]